MKTITLKEAYAKATPGKLSFDRRNDGLVAFRIAGDGYIIGEALFQNPVAGFTTSAPNREQAQHNAALLAHVFNVLPEVAEALKVMLRLHRDTAKASLRGLEATNIADAALAKASQVKIP